VTYSDTTPSPEENARAIAEHWRAMADHADRRSRIIVNAISEAWAQDAAAHADFVYRVEREERQDSRWAGEVERLQRELAAERLRVEQWKETADSWERRATFRGQMARQVMSKHQNVLGSCLECGNSYPCPTVVLLATADSPLDTEADAVEGVEPWASGTVVPLRHITVDPKHVALISPGNESGTFEVTCTQPECPIESSVFETRTECVEHANYHADTMARVANMMWFLPPRIVAHPVYDAGEGVWRWTCPIGWCEIAGVDEREGAGVARASTHAKGHWQTGAALSDGVDVDVTVTEAAGGWMVTCHRGCEDTVTSEYAPDARALASGHAEWHRSY
jgi:hypothetical protein